MKKLAVLLIVSLMVVFGTTQSKAYELQINPGGSVDATGLSTVFFDVVFSVDSGETVSLDTYTFNMYYDNVELAWNSGSSSLYAPSPLISQLLGPVNGSTSGFIGNINAGGFSGAATIESSFTLATLAFDVSSPANDGAADVWFDTADDSRFGFTIGGGGVLMSDIAINSSLPDVTVVPEPISSTLFLIGGATLGFRRFRKTKAAA